MAVTLPVDAQSRASGSIASSRSAPSSRSTPEAGAAAVEALFAEHRFTDGIDLLRQGTPTNNTDGAASGFTTDLAADEALVAQEVDGVVADAVLDHAGKSDAQRLAEALGIAFEAVSDWPSARDGTMRRRARHEPRALARDARTFLRDMVGARMTPALKSEIERFFLTYVTGRTLLPNIRVGAQPYGVLATSDLRVWTESAGRTGARRRHGDDRRGPRLVPPHFFEIAETRRRRSCRSGAAPIRSRRRCASSASWRARFPSPRARRSPTRSPGTRSISRT